ncbi:hypothetical protein [Streptomyces lavendulae]|uniref:hypothetical protein n=1 Tax=Streptomyces lavendulae TaxID=1914 RepID=UPI0033EA4411
MGDLDCGCDVRCHTAHCACIYTYDDGACYCECWDSPVSQKDKPRRKLDRKELVQISTKNASMTELAAFLAEFCDFEILVPARTLKDEVTTKVRKVPLEKALSELGMLIAD